MKPFGKSRQNETSSPDMTEVPHSTPDTVPTLTEHLQTLNDTYRLEHASAVQAVYGDALGVVNEFGGSKQRIRDGGRDIVRVEAAEPADVRIAGEEYLAYLYTETPRRGTADPVVGLRLVSPGSPKVTEYAQDLVTLTSDGALRVLTSADEAVINSPDDIMDISKRIVSIQRANRAAKAAVAPKPKPEPQLRPKQSLNPQNQPESPSPAGVFIAGSVFATVAILGAQHFIFNDDDNNAASTSPFRTTVERMYDISGDNNDSTGRYALDPSGAEDTAQDFDSYGYKLSAKTAVKAGETLHPEEISVVSPALYGDLDSVAVPFVDEDSTVYGEGYDSVSVKDGIRVIDLLYGTPNSKGDTCETIPVTGKVPKGALLEAASDYVDGDSTKVLSVKLAHGAVKACWLGGDTEQFHATEPFVYFDIVPGTPAKHKTK